MWYERALVTYLSYAQTFGRLLPSINEKKIEMNFTNSDGFDLIYYDIDFFGGPSEKTDHLINNENVNID